MEGRYGERARRDHAQSMESRSYADGEQRGRSGRGGAWSRAAPCGYGRRRFEPHSGVGMRRVRPEAELRSRAVLPARLRRGHVSHRADHEDGGGRGAPPQRHLRLRRAGLDELARGPSRLARGARRWRPRTSHCVQPHARSREGRRRDSFDRAVGASRNNPPRRSRAESTNGGYPSVCRSWDRLIEMISSSAPPMPTNRRILSARRPPIDVP